LVKKMDISSRLQEERKRIGLTQAALAVKLEATKRSVINWEGGAALPGAEVLSRYAAAGADVLYILTGERMGGASAPEPARAVSPGDRVLLENFHAAPAGVQAGVKTTLGAFSDASGQARSRKRAA
jgi:transcriptional regulator with XRE-family HTH domain